MVNEFLGEGVPHRQPAVPQTYNMASLLSEIQAVPHHHHHQPPPGALQQQHRQTPQQHDGETRKRLEILHVCAKLYNIKI